MQSSLRFPNAINNSDLLFALGDRKLLVASINDIFVFNTFHKINSICIRLVLNFKFYTVFLEETIAFFDKDIIITVSIMSNKNGFLYECT